MKKHILTRFDRFLQEITKYLLLVIILLLHRIEKVLKLEYSCQAKGDFYEEGSCNSFTYFMRSFNLHSAERLQGK
jgi:hypothetical protein